MIKAQLLAKAYFKKEFTIFRRYALNSLGGIITIYFIFLLIFLGYRGAAGASPQFGEMLEGLVIGYLLWVFSLMVYQDVSHTIQTECREGTLEQLYMSAYPFGLVISMKVLASFFINLITIVILLFVMMWTTGQSLNIDVISIAPLIVFTLIGILGIGFAIGGVTLIFKRMDSYLQIVQFALIGLVAAPAEPIIWLRMLPASWGSTMINRVMSRGYSLVDFAFSDYLWLVGVGLFYLLAGYQAYKFCEKKAMERGLLGHY